MDNKTLNDEIDEILEQERLKSVAMSAESAKWQKKVRDPQFHTMSKNHNLYSVELNKLSNKMKNTLVCKLQRKEYEKNVSTERALNKRKLIIDGKLSEEGTLLAIASAGLKTQCEIIGAEYISEQINMVQGVEESVLAYYRSLGWSGFFSEGHVLFDLLHAISFSFLKKIAKDTFKEIDKQSYEILHATIFSDFSIDVKEEIISKIQSISDKELLNSLRHLKKLKTNTKFDLGYGVLDFRDRSPHETFYKGREVFSLYKDIPKDKLVKIASLCISGAIGLTGWPDLVIHKDGMYKQIEVKKSDKLILSQIITLKTLIENGFEIEVFKAKKR